MKPRFNLRKRDFTDEDNSLQNDLSSDLIGLKSHRHTEKFVQDVSNTDLEDTKPRRAMHLAEKHYTLTPVSKSKFNWLSFWTMLVSIGVVVVLVIFVPGPFDEIAAAIALSAINAFIANHRK